jgi:RsiW-degrading membrane proteinase PrsW (M82 family)
MYPPHGHGHPPHYGSDTGGSNLPDPERVRRYVGIGCYTIWMLIGAFLLFLAFVVLPYVSGGAREQFISMAVGAVLAFPAAIVYLTVPRLLDRYDPEPAYALLMALAWGGVAACGVAVLINSSVGDLVGGQAGEFLSVVVSAPIVEEGMKGLFVLGFFYFFRREFDGVVDGIIYATFVAIGFAAVENVVYYARAGLEAGEGGMIVTFVLRGLLTPWGHPLYTSMTGIGVGLSRESHQTWVRVVAPVVGYCAAVSLHAVWNGSSVFFGGLGPMGGAMICLSLFLWLIFVIAFLGMVIWLVARRGRIIRAHLVDEVALGHLTKAELDIVVSAFGGLVAYWRKGSLGVEFVRAVARLALSKWHTARAMRGKQMTVSMDFIAPLRRRIRELRAQGASPV